MKRNRVWSVLIVLLAGLMLNGIAGAATQDNDPPAISHTLVSTAFSDANLIIRAKVADASSIQRVSLQYRTKGTANFYSVNMSRVGSEYRAAIPASYMTPGTIEYYIRATDAAGNSSAFPAEDKPQTISVRKDNTLPEPELVEPTGSVTANGFSVFMVFRDLAGNVDPNSVRVFYNSKDVTADAKITSTGVTYDVPANAVTLHPSLTVEVSDMAGNRVRRSFSFWKAADWSRELRVDYQSGEEVEAKLDMSWGWGPLYLGANLNSNDPHYSGEPGQPQNSFEARYDARLLRLAIGDTTSSVAPLALDALRQRGGDLTLRLGPLSLQGVYGNSKQLVAGEEYERDVVAIRPALDTRGLDFALSLVKVRDDWSEAGDIADVNPEVNYILDTQLGWGMLGGRLGWDVEGALSIYHDNARGDLWETLDGIEDETVKSYLDRIPPSVMAFLQRPDVRSFLQLPDLQYGVPKVDAGLQANLRTPLPWSEASAQVYHYGKSYYTIAGGGDNNVEGIKASYNTIRLLNALQLSAECGRKIDNVKPLTDWALEMFGVKKKEPETDRTAYNTCTAEVSMGPAGRLNLDLGAAYTDEAPLGEDLTETNTSYTVKVRNMRLGLFGATVRMGAEAGLAQLTDLTDLSGLSDKETQTAKLTTGLDVGSWSYDAAYKEKREIDSAGALEVRNPGLDGSITWTLRKPRLIFFTPQDIRLRASGSADRSLDAAGNELSAKTSVKADAEVRLTQGLRINGAWQQISPKGEDVETKWSTGMRFRF